MGQQQAPAGGGVQGPRLPDPGGGANAMQALHLVDIDHRAVIAGEGGEDGGFTGLLRQGADFPVGDLPQILFVPLRATQGQGTGAEAVEAAAVLADVAAPVEGLQQGQQAALGGAEFTAEVLEGRAPGGAGQQLENIQQAVGGAVAAVRGAPGIGGGIAAHGLASPSISMGVSQSNPTERDRAANRSASALVALSLSRIRPRPSSPVVKRRGGSAMRENLSRMRAMRAGSPGWAPWRAAMRSRVSLTALLS